MFDRKLRLLVMDAIERIEVSVRTQLALNHSQQHGPFGYAINKASLPKFHEIQHVQYLERLKTERKRSKEPFVMHFSEKYGDSHPHLPIWMACEIMSFGNTLTFFRNCPRSVKKPVAYQYAVPDKVFESWVLALNTIRNICAHHARLWNRELGIKPLIPKRDTHPKWHDPFSIENNKLFAILSICLYCLKHIAPQSNWKHRVHDLLSTLEEPISHMGFPGKWEASSLWKE